MWVGAAIVELHLHGCQSLKQKRGIVRSIVGRVRNRFNVSVAEVGGQDKWQLSQLGLSASGGEATLVRRVLDRATLYIEELHLAEVLSVDIEIVDFPHHENPWTDDGDQADEAAEFGEGWEGGNH
jgi:uncharacterized protein YlxP (DUF503 family)